MTQAIDPPHNEQVRIEDDRTGMSVEAIQRAFADNLFYLQGTYDEIAKPADFYRALAYTMRDRLLRRFLDTVRTYLKKDVKVVYYLSAEFLMGRHLGNSLINLGIYEQVRKAMAESGLNLDELLEQEDDPGLGNGGLGRLAACFLDSLATLEIPAMGHGIRYEFGIFTQNIQDGWQAEIPDKWLRFGNPWEIARPSEEVEVKFGGHTEGYHDEKGHYRVAWIPQHTVVGVPYDTPVPGYKVNTVNPLRLWKAEASVDFKFEEFNAGNYDGAVDEKMSSETISKVLYPNDNTPQGKELRLKQQYFFVACALHDILRVHLYRYPSLDNLHEKAAIQLNDTHPAIAIPEMMRLLIDERAMDWDQAWYITQKTFAYTNHTLLPEALEKWSLSLFEKLLPRHLEIIYEINNRFLTQVKTWYPKDPDLISRLSIIEEGGEKKVRMAHLASVGSHAINGVAALHSELLKEGVLKDFYKLFPEKFFNQTNGVTPRRWILMSNPTLSQFYNQQLGGDAWLTNLDLLKKLEDKIDDPKFQAKWLEIKRQNKQELADYIWKHNRLEVDPKSLFDIQVKRIHEYKRQHLDVLHIISLYNRIKKNPSMNVLPRTFIFGGKAAPGYFMAKLIIKLINSVANVVNNDPDVHGRIKVVFLANFNASLGQLIYPAADLSEQISTAGMEASGTGNMKFAMNGAMTIGTLDGANIEIREEVGAENFFLFGLTAQEVADLKAKGYQPREYYNNCADLKEVIDLIAEDYFSVDHSGLFQPLVDNLLYDDPFMLLADYADYIRCQEEVSQAFADEEKWVKMSIYNGLRMGKFSSDRTIRGYVKEIWQAEPVTIQVQEYDPLVAGVHLSHK
jgi:starch phosphorylase